MKTVLITVPIALAVGFLSSVVSGQGARPQASIGYVSAQRILSEANDAKAEIGRFQGIQQQRNNELKAKQQVLEDIRQQLTLAKDSEQRADLLQREQQQRADVEQATARAQTELQLLQRQVQSNLQGRVNSILADLSKGEGFQIVLNSDTAVVWAAPGLDLTEAVVTRLNTKAVGTPKP